MTRLTKAVLLTVAVLFLVSIVAAKIVSGGAPQISMQDLEAKYASDDSLFADIDGIRTHYMDQGSGDVVVLLHASFMNLRTWDSMAEALSSQYRVIRMDRLLSGLTGEDPKKLYSVEREMELLNGLLDHLGVEDFHLLATSSAGTVAFRYTALHPERITSLILINSAGLPRTAATNPNRGRGNWLARWIDRKYRSEGFWRKSVATNFVAPNEPPEWLIEMLYDTNRRENYAEQGSIYMRNYKTGDPEHVLSQITAPTFVMWGMENATVMHLEADVFAHWLRCSPVRKKKYADVAHYMYLEIPDVIEADVLEFLQDVTDNPAPRTLNCPAAATTDASDTNEKTSIAEIIRGKTVCKDTTNENAVCGIEHWTMFINRNGSRYLHIASDNIITALSKQAVVWIDPENTVREAYVNTTTDSIFVGSSYIVLRDDKAYVAVDDSEFGAGSADVKLEVREQPASRSSIGAGPVAGDIAQFVDHERGENAQEKSVYWVGGRGSTMMGRFFSSENSFIGRDELKLADGREVTAAHFRMKTGSEIWLLEPYGILLRIQLEFGAVKGQVYETTELEILKQSF